MESGEPTDGRVGLLNKIRRESLWSLAFTFEAHAIHRRERKEHKRTALFDVLLWPVFVISAFFVVIGIHF